MTVLEGGCTYWMPEGQASLNEGESRLRPEEERLQRLRTKACVCAASRPLPETRCGPTLPVPHTPVNHYGSRPPSDAFPLASGPHALWVCLPAPRLPAPSTLGVHRGLPQAPILLSTLFRQAHLLPRLHLHLYLPNFSRPAEQSSNPWVGTEPLLQKVHTEVNLCAGTCRAAVRSQWGP